jgi:N-acetylglucosamine-6-sulfatase
MYRLEQSRVSRRARLPLAAGLLALLCAAVLGLQTQARAQTEPTEQPPSFVVIQTDDQTLDQLYDTFRQEPALRVMPNTLDLIAKRGMTLNRYYVSYPLCCPSRVSMLTGRYAHNHNVRGNVPPNAGYTGFSFRGAMTHNLATWLQGAGYRTIHVGKFLNGYGDEPWDDGKTVPPGWNAWHTVVKADTHHYFYGYTLNNNGMLEGPYGDPGSWDTREYGVRDDIGCPFAPLNGLPCYHVTDNLTNIAAEELLGTSSEQPFYLQLDYTAPHGDFRRPAGPEPAPRHYDWFKGAPFPHSRSEGFAEGNVSDKPSFIKDAPYLSLRDIHTYRVYYQKMLDSLRSVDDGVKRIIDTLGYLQRLRNTYVIFMSDNGFFFGEHRLTGGKFLAYEPAVHVPFLIRGPGIKPNSSTGELTANVDVAPTILELAGVEADKSIDGRSMVPFLRDPELRSRRPLLFESFVETADVEANATSQARASARRGNGASASILAPPKDYEGIRLGPFKYIAWPSGEKELYDINKDPNELNNIVRVPNYFPVRNLLHREMRRLEDCVGRTCQEVGPKVPLTRKERQAQIRQEKEERREKQREEREKRREEKR